MSYRDTRFGPINWIDYGGDGQTALFVHGLGGSALNWMAVAPRLARRYRAIAIDLPGFGLSPPGNGYGLATHRDAIDAFLDTVPHPVLLVGNSTGGLLAQMIAAERPEAVDKLVLIAPATPPALPDPRLDWRTVARLVFQATPILGTVYARHVVSKYSPTELVHLGLRMVTDWPGRVPVSVIEAQIELQHVRRELPWMYEATNRTATSIALHYLRRGDFKRTAGRITAPTLVVQGLRDHIVSPTAVEWLCALRPDWKLVQLEDTGHTPMLDAPLRTLETIEAWLDDLDHATVEIEKTGA